MKLRDGFVSNSSSSSFVIAFKRKAPSEADIARCLQKRKFTKKLASDLGLDFKEIIDAAVLVLRESVVHSDIISNVYELKYIEDNDWQCSLSDYFGADIEKFVLKCLRGGWKVIISSVCDEYDWDQAALCWLGINCEDDRLRIFKPAGY